MPYYIATIYVKLMTNQPSGLEEKMFGPFVRRYDLRVPADFRFLAEADMRRAFQDSNGVELGPISLAKNQNSLPLKGEK